MMETECRRIAETITKHPGEKLTTLAHLINSKTLLESHKELETGKATGIDGVTKEEYEKNLENNVNELVAAMKRMSYRPLPVRRTYIEKENGKLRPLGIPAYQDKLVQKVISAILNAIYEPEFMNFSYGFRPGRKCHDAIREIASIEERGKVNFVVDADIKGFFDNVDHKWMVQFLEHRIGDPKFIRLIARFLIAGVMEEEKYWESDKGTPQGGNISPILANIYLHYVLDLWFEKEIKRKCKGEAYIVRYADDFACCFQYQKEAEEFLKSLEDRLEKFGLGLAAEKTKIIEFGRFAEGDREKRGMGKPETFDFLGFTHFCSKSKGGKFRVKRKTSRKKQKSKLKAVKAWLWKNMHKPVVNTIKVLNQKLRGHYQYYGVTDNIQAMRVFRYRVIKQLYWTLNRRGQRKSYNKRRFESLLEKHPIVLPRIYVNVYG